MTGFVETAGYARARPRQPQLQVAPPTHFKIQQAGEPASLREGPPRPSPERVDAVSATPNFPGVDFSLLGKSSVERAQVSATLHLPWGNLHWGNLPQCRPKSKEMNLKLFDGRQKFPQCKTSPV